MAENALPAGWAEARAMDRMDRMEAIEADVPAAIADLQDQVARLTAALAAVGLP